MKRKKKQIFDLKARQAIISLAGALSLQVGGSYVEYLIGFLDLEKKKRRGHDK